MIWHVFCEIISHVGPCVSVTHISCTQRIRKFFMFCPQSKTTLAQANIERENFVWQVKSTTFPSNKKLGKYYTKCFLCCGCGGSERYQMLFLGEALQQSFFFFFDKKKWGPFCCWWSNLRASLAESANFYTVWRMNVIFTFIYKLFQMHFTTDSLFYLNIISSFIIYYFFNNYTSSNIFLFNT